jgi:flavin-dependent dehydrogenase
MVGAAVLRAGVAAGATVYAHFSGIEDRGYRWFYGSSAAAGAIPTNEGRHAVFATVPPVRLRACHGSRGSLLLRTIAEINPSFGETLLAGAAVSVPVAFSGMPGVLRQATGSGWALVGDAGYYNDPLTVHGITDALRDATLLAAAATVGTSGLP